MASIREDVQRLEADSNLNGNCLRNKYLKSLIEKQKSYADQMSYALNSDCCRRKPQRAVTDRMATGLVDLIGTQYQTNLRA